MEDAHTQLLSLPGDKDAYYFAVYDGHGGGYFPVFQRVRFQRVHEMYDRRHPVKLSNKKKYSWKF